MPDTKPAARPVRPRGLRYVGNGAGLTDIPARDLSPDDLEVLAAQPYVKRRLAATAKGLADLLVSVRVGDDEPLYETTKPSVTDGQKE